MFVNSKDSKIYNFKNSSFLIVLSANLKVRFQLRGVHEKHLSSPISVDHSQRSE